MTDDQQQLHPRIADAVRVVRLDRNVVLVHRASGRRLELDEEQTLLLDYCNGSATVAAIIEAVKPQLGPDADELLTQLLAVLRQHDMLDTDDIDVDLESELAEPSVPSELLAAAYPAPQPVAMSLPSRRLALLANVPAMAHFDEATLGIVARAMEETEVPVGFVLVREGEQADRFFVVVAGAVEVRRHGAVVSELGAGDFFGETALLFDQPRTATVVAIQPTRLLSLDKGAFQRLVRAYMLGQRELLPTLLNRLHNPRQG